MENRPPIPVPLERELRQEAYFGCVRCGCPIIHIHHIVPWHIVKTHEKHNLVALCPNCHADIHANVYTKEKLFEDMANPYNKRTRCVQKQFFLGKYEDLVLYMGGNKFRNVQNVVTVNGKKLIYFNIDSDGRALLNANFFDETGKLRACIINNIWKTFISDDVWDISYSGGKLKINLVERKIFLELITSGNEVVIDAVMYAGKSKISTRNGKMILDTPTCKQVTFVGCEMSNCKNGVFIG